LDDRWNQTVGIVFELLHTAPSGLMKRKLSKSIRGYPPECIAKSKMHQHVHGMSPLMLGFDNFDAISSIWGACGF
jgi:hypothetical protein